MTACADCGTEVNYKPGHEDYFCKPCRRKADGIQRRYECILIVEIDAYSRDEAENEASDLADSIAEVFIEKTTGVQAVGGDHNAYDRLHISMDGRDIRDILEKGL